MAMRMCNNNNDDFAHLHKPKRHYLSAFRGRKGAHKSKAPKGITIKKRKSELQQCSRDDDYLKKRRVVYSRDLFPDCVSVNEYKSLGKISAGSYGVVYKVKHNKTGEIMAMKEEFNGLSATTEMEIGILKSLGGHPSIIGFKGVAVDECDGVYVVMEYMQTDLGRYIATNEVIQVKGLIKQLLEGVKFLHENGVMHRDLKPSNVLVNESGGLKICDFGLATRFGEEEVGSYSAQVGTLWYRAPEMLLGEESYSCAVDMWAVGCIMAELVLRKVLFRGESEEDQLHVIYCILGHPNAKNVCSSISSAKCILSEAGFNLLKGLLSCDPSKRMTAETALNHVWFAELSS